MNPIAALFAIVSHLRDVAHQLQLIALSGVTDTFLQKYKTGFMFTTKFRLNQKKQYFDKRVAKQECTDVRCVRCVFPAALMPPPLAFALKTSDNVVSSISAEMFTKHVIAGITSSVSVCGGVNAYFETNVDHPAITIINVPQTVHLTVDLMLPCQGDFLRPIVALYCKRKKILGKLRTSYNFVEIEATSKVRFSSQSDGDIVCLFCVLISDKSSESTGFAEVQGRHVQCVCRWLERTVFKLQSSTLNTLANDTVTTLEGKYCVSAVVIKEM